MYWIIKGIVSRGFRRATDDSTDSQIMPSLKIEIWKVLEQELKYDAGILNTSGLSTGIIFSNPQSRETIPFNINILLLPEEGEGCLAFFSVFFFLIISFLTNKHIKLL